MDVSPLYRTADRLDEVAGVLRGRAARLQLGVGTTHWYSVAARVYFDNVDELTAQLGSCAARANDLADHVRSYAMRVLADGP